MCLHDNLCILGKKKSRKLEKSRKSRKASTDEEKSEKGGSSSDSEEERKHVEKTKKIRESNRGGEVPFTRVYNGVNFSIKRIHLYLQIR